VPAPPGGCRNVRGTARAEFFVEAAATHDSDGKLAGLAERRALSALVKEHASAIKRDASKSMEDLRQVAERAKVTLPRSIPTAEPSRAAEHRYLAELSGSSFDREFMSAAIDENVRAIELFMEASDSGDPAIAPYARKTLPELKMRLEKAIVVVLELAEQQSTEELT
jgi:putative membrane protein